MKRPKGDSYYGKKSVNYEKRRKKQDWWHVEQREMLALLSELPRNLSVIDIPFGTGRFVPYYLEFGYQVHGLDASEDMLEAAKVALGDQYERCKTRTGNAAALPYEDGEFDLVVSTRFLRDIILFKDALKMLSEMARVTSKYAIIQLGENPDRHREPDDNEVMGSSMSRDRVDQMLRKVKLEAVERRLVKQGDDEGDIHHVFCKKV